MYFISSTPLSNAILNVYVHDMSLFSDHCAITLKLKICRDNLVEDILEGKGPNISCTPLPDKFLWSEETKVRYQEAFHTSEVKDRISDFENELVSNSVEVQSLVDKLTDVMILAAYTM